MPLDIQDIPYILLFDTYSCDIMDWICYSEYVKNVVSLRIPVIIAVSCKANQKQWDLYEPSSLKI